jgi:hypothetical protein
MHNNGMHHTRAHTQTHTHTHTHREREREIGGGGREEDRESGEVERVGEKRGGGGKTNVPVTSCALVDNLATPSSPSAVHLPSA